MLTAFGRHALFDLTVQTDGDIHIDAHHTVEDTAIVLGEALREALGDKAGIRRFGDALVPLDEALVQAVVDVSGRPYCVHTGEPEGQEFVTIGGALPRLADPARLRDPRLPRPDRPARAGARRPRPAPHRRGAVQGVRPRAARRGRVRPARDRRALDQGHALSAPTRVVVLDYGSGNLRSAVRALERAGADVTLTADHDDGAWRPTAWSSPASARSPRAWPACARSTATRSSVAGWPAAGRCSASASACRSCSSAGSSTASRPRAATSGPGRSSGSQAPVVPHMGWNTVDVADGTTLFAGIEDERFYFVHSYGVRDWTLETNGRTRPPLVTWAEHGGDRFVAAVENGPLSATQFHPEKSGDAGAALLRNWVGGLRGERPHEQGARPAPRGARAGGGDRGGRPGGRGGAPRAPRRPQPGDDVAGCPGRARARPACWPPGGAGRSAPPSRCCSRSTCWSGWSSRTGRPGAGADGQPAGRARAAHHAVRPPLRPADETRRRLLGFP